MEEYNYQILVNIEGEDKAITVPDMWTAEWLLNDFDAARQYYLSQQASNASEEASDNLESEAFQTEGGEGSSHEEGPIWVRKKPTNNDNAATALMLRLRDQHNEKFADKKNNKKQLWAAIASELEKNKFILGANGGERCRQKFANLSKTYLKFIRNQKTTGAAFMEHPPFFEEMHSILGEKHKTQPKYLVDSFADDETMPEAPIAEEAMLDAPTMNEGASCSYTAEPSITDRFKNLRETPQKLNKGDQVLQELRSHQLEQRKQFEILSSHLKKTEEQRDKLINIMQEFFSRKRKRQDEDSDGE